MSEKPEDSFDDEEDDDLVDSEDEEEDLDEIFRDLEAPRKRRSARTGPEPAWRKLERYLEDRRTAGLLADFDDYDVGEEGAAGGRRRRK